MPRLPLQLLLAAALLASLLPAGPAGAADEGCAGFRPQGGQTRDAPAATTIVLDFRLTAAVTATVAASMGLHHTWPDPALRAERGVVAGVLEHANGTRVVTLDAYAGWAYGVQADAAGEQARVLEWDGACTSIGSSATVALPPGDYRFVVLGASERPNRIRAEIPASATVLQDARVDAHRISAADLDCAGAARANVVHAAGEALVGCSEALDGAARSYRVLVARWGPDETHDVRWVTPSGAVQRCAKPGWCLDAGAGPGGAWTLEVPRYASPCTTPHASPATPCQGDVGILGAFAGAP